MLNLLGQAFQPTVERGGLYWDIRTGISRGCPLSPLLRALYLKVLDQRLSGTEDVLRALHGRHPRADEDPLAIAAGRAQVEPDLRRTESLAAPPTRPSSGASSEALIFLAITSAVARYGSRSERFRITRHGFIGFMSNRIQHPQVPFVWMST